MSHSAEAMSQQTQQSGEGEPTARIPLVTTPHVTPSRPAPPPPAAAPSHRFRAQSASFVDHLTALGPAAFSFAGQPFIPLKPKDFSHLALTKPAVAFSWWLCNLKNAVLASHPGYVCIFRP